MLFVKANARRNVHVRDPVAVGQAKGFLACKVASHALQPAAGLRQITGVHQRHSPRFGHAVVHLHAVFRHMKGHVGHMQKVVREELLDDVALVSQANDEVVDAKVRIDFEDVPKDGPAADLDHRLGPHGGFFADAGTQPRGENDCFQVRDPFLARDALPTDAPF